MQPLACDSPERVGSLSDPGVKAKEPPVSPAWGHRALSMTVAELKDLGGKAMNKFSITFRGYLSEKVTNEQLIYVVREALNLYIHKVELPKSITLDALSAMSNEITWEDK